MSRDRLGRTRGLPNTWRDFQRSGAQNPASKFAAESNLVKQETDSARGGQAGMVKV